MLSNQQFDRTRRLALSLAGIELVERHRELLDHRSRRLGIRDSAGLDALLNAAEKGEATATQQLLCLLTTKFTGFFRHPRHFEIAAQHALRAARQRDRTRLWSAGAATGEEPFSLAMALIEAFGQDDPPAGILATDVDVDALAVAARGEYSEPVVKAVKAERRTRFFSRNDAVEENRERGDHAASGRKLNDAFDEPRKPSLSREAKRPESRAPQLIPRCDAASASSSTAAFQVGQTGAARCWSVAPAVRRLVEFRPLNLAGTDWPVEGPFDVIFCRNVLMYLEARHRCAALERMASLLAPEGLLLLDPTEHPGQAGHLFTPGAGGVYSLRLGSAQAAALNSTSMRTEL
jgi:chemotaxis protein methyltransferase CheR